jgi:2-keto-3-deoxy-L-rhamnonate aldolase RhmA
VKRPLKERLTSARGPVFGTWISSASVVIADALKDLGFDWVMIDTEHSPINRETLATIVAILNDSGPRPMVRVGDVDQYMVKQALDAGAHGVLAPLVNTEADAATLVRFAKYPPDGVRGAAAAAGSRYGLELKSYLRDANGQTVVGVQIETRSALEHLDAIAAVPGVDLLFVGPQDLTLNLGLGDERTHPMVRESMRSVVAACERHGKIPGTLVIDPEEKRAAVDLGFRFISLAADVRFLIQGAKYYLGA